MLLSWNYGLNSWVFCHHRCTFASRKGECRSVWSILSLYCGSREAVLVVLHVLLAFYICFCFVFFKLCHHLWSFFKIFISFTSCCIELCVSRLLWDVNYCFVYKSCTKRVDVKKTRKKNTKKTLVKNHTKKDKKGNSIVLLWMYFNVFVKKMIIKQSILAAAAFILRKGCGRRGCNAVKCC